MNFLYVCQIMFAFMYFDLDKEGTFCLICNFNNHFILDWKIYFRFLYKITVKTIIRVDFLLIRLGFCWKFQNFGAQESCEKYIFLKRFLSSCPKNAIFKLLKHKNHLLRALFSPNSPSGILGGCKSTLIMSWLLI